MSSYTKITAYILSLCLWYRFRHYLQDWISSSDDKREPQSLQVVLFFPDTQIKCHDFHQTNCDEVIAKHPMSSLCQLLSLLKSCQRSLYICMYCLSYEPIIQTIEELSLNKYIDIRIILNGKRNVVTNEEVDHSTTRLRQLFKNGIQLKTIIVSNDGLMHNKFAIIDNNILINGSLNWTQNAIFFSYNDMIATTDPKLVLQYWRQFNHFWSLN
ncbi:uncharacterized protein LOC128959954 [Oppia nitens]|uniref:uncharacterized protein LOC128959954 n=1 Tax=Oppia nitens TaxID=1686743 RepID=UPI0023DA797E|nr:uncharacterized protein LOC128959954 [Oppia nitens]